MQSIQTPKDLQKRLEMKNPNDVLLDVRTPDEFNSGHIEGAVSFNISTLDLINQIKKLDKSKTYILYCRSGSRSKMASMILSANNFNVVNCQFGFIHLSGSDLQLTN